VISSAYSQRLLCSVSLFVGHKLANSKFSLRLSAGRLPQVGGSTALACGCSNESTTNGLNCNSYHNRTDINQSHIYKHTCGTMTKSKHNGSKASKAGSGPKNGSKKAAPKASKPSKKQVRSYRSTCKHIRMFCVNQPCSLLSHLLLSQLIRRQVAEDRKVKADVKAWAVRNGKPGHSKADRAALMNDEVDARRRQV
jgi:hypothetical protein